MKNTMRLSSSISLAVPSPRPRLRLPLLFVTVAMLLLLISTASSTFAGSATWKTSPGSSDWNTANNWSPSTVPNGPSDTATFATSNTTGVFVSASTEVNSIVFNPGASPFTVTPNPLFTLTISGVGITNNSGITQNFVTAGDSSGGVGRISFLNSATAGGGTVFANNGEASGSAGAGVIQFNDSSTAGNGTFTNNGGATSGGGGVMLFLNSSSAGNGTFTNNGGAANFGGGAVAQFNSTSSAGNGTFTNNGGAASDAVGGFTGFHESSSAGNGTFTNNGGAVTGAGGGTTRFLDISTAGVATLIANGGLGGVEGGRIFFVDDSTGGHARVEVFGNGNLEISYHHARGLTIGSIEGNGLVFLGALKLIVGSNNASTIFSGVIQDGGQNGGIGGSLTKIGSGKLVLRHRNSYTGGTTVKRGKLMVNNDGGSGTGSGPVQVNGGILGGKGIIAGPVTVGTGSGQGAVLAPGYLHGAGSLGALTIQSPLTFNADAIYNVGQNSSTAIADEVIANGVTINAGAQFSFEDIRSGALPIGTVFTVIDNTAATPIAGTFSNLPDGSMFTVNGNTYQANYEGRDGNDLTLMVVP